jgi:hypothetical protein
MLARSTSLPAPPVSSMDTLVLLLNSLPVRVSVMVLLAALLCARSRPL